MAMCSCIQWTALRCNLRGEHNLQIYPTNDRAKEAESLPSYSRSSKDLQVIELLNGLTLMAWQFLSFCLLKEHNV